ncbi:hypothetical protein LINPERHAP2_LOCUS39520, partial [Linum perenne]
MTPKMTPIYVAKMTPTIRAAIATLFPSWNATGVKQWTQAEDPRSPTKMASRLFLLSALLLLAISIISSCESGEALECSWIAIAIFGTFLYSQVTAKKGKAPEVGKKD